MNTKILLISCLVWMSSHLIGNHDTKINEKLIIIVTPSYNNIDWWQWNLESLINQNYTNYRIIITDDCSTDGTGQAIESYIFTNHLEGKVTLIRNTQRRGALYNLYTMIHSCPNEAIIVTVDGDDALPHSQILSKLNMIYSTEDVWLTYGQFVEYPSGVKGWCCPMPQDVISHNAFREFPHLPSHLRTFYAWLFKSIKKEDLLDEDGEFYSMTCDYATMMPMIEMAGERHKCIEEIMYLYNNSNPISDHRTNWELQSKIARTIRAKPRYNRLPNNPTKQPNQFFITGQINDLVPISERTNFNMGKITVLTEPIHEEASQRIQGHTAVTGSVLRGFRKLGLPMNYNPSRVEDVGDHVFILVNVSALQQAIELKRQRRIKTLIVGPNILNNPNEYNHILGSPEIDWYIAPCDWARESNCQEEPLIINKTAIWYAGVDPEFWQPQQEKQETKRMLVYWKTEPESFCIEIEALLQKHGWQTLRLRYGTHSQQQYKEALQSVDAAVFISVSESQGIALAECWAMNVPTFVWDPGIAFIYNRWLPVTSAPYISPGTGYLWQSYAELEELLNSFDYIKNQFFPRQWILDYMTDEASVKLLLEIIKYSL